MFAVIKCKYTYEFFDKPFLLFSVKSNKVNFTNSDEYTLYCDIDNIDSRSLQDLQSDRLIFIFIPLDKDQKPVASSNTYDINLNWFPIQQKPESRLKIQYQNLTSHPKLLFGIGKFYL